MKKFNLVILAMVTSAMSANLAIADDNIVQLDPTVLIELQSSIKADRLQAEKSLILDIEDEFVQRKQLFRLNRKFLNSRRHESEQVLVFNTIAYSNSSSLISQ